MATVLSDTAKFINNHEAWHVQNTIDGVADRIENEAVLRRVELFSHTNERRRGVFLCPLLL